MSDNNFNEKNIENQDFSNSDDLNLDNPLEIEEDSNIEQESAFLKRKNQFKSWKTDEDEDEYENESIDKEDEYQKDYITINNEDDSVEDELIDEDNSSNDIEFIFEDNENNQENEVFFEDGSLYSKLIQSENYENNKEETDSNVENTDSNIEDDKELIELESESNEEVEDEPSIIDSLLSDADEIINEKEYIDIDFEEEKVEEDYEDVSAYENEEDVDSDDIDEVVSENDEYEFDGFYDDEELDEIRNSSEKKKTVVKIAVGIGFLVLLTILALGLRRFLNKDLKPSTSTEANITPTQGPSIPDDEQNKGPVIIDNIIDDKDDVEEKKPVVEEDKDDFEEDKEDEDIIIEDEVSLFIQTYTGQVLSINDENIIVSYNLTYDKQKILDTNFTNYINSKFKKVWVNEKEKVYHLNKDEEDGLVEMTISQALDKEYALCDNCRENINIKNNPNIIKDYNYLNEENLINVQYHKFIYESLDMIPNWVSIGSEITITYIQDAESLLNEIIEVSKVEKVVENNPDNKDEESKEEILPTNLWGEDFEKIVARINDRREHSADDEGVKIEDTIDLTLKENVSVDISIGRASIVWFQVAWKSNSVTSDVPNLEDVSVELMTSNGSLINEENIDRYGKMWVDRGVINFVIRDTKAGLWKVLFTKDTGTYLGDVVVQAVPITGFLQINKADAKYTDGKLHVIWEAKGVPDDYCKVDIYARNGDKDVLIYAGNTLDDGIHTVDMVAIDTTKIAGNTYDIVIRITDIDVTASKPQRIQVAYVTDEFIVKNVEIPKIK